MKKRSVIRITTFCLAAAVAAGGYALQNGMELRSATAAALCSDRRCFSQLQGDLSRMDAALSKAALCTSPETVTSVCAEIYADAETACRTVESLPVQGGDTAQLLSWCNRVGDYARGLLMRAARGGRLSREECETLDALSDAARTLCASLGKEGCASAADGFFRGKAGSATGLAEVIGGLNEAFPEAPVLLYDGPFSDHVLSATPACVSAHPTEIDQKEALRRLAGALSVSEGSLSVIGECKGTIPAWCISCEGGQNCTAQIAKNGGGVLLLLSDAPAGEQEMSRENALAAADVALASLGFAGLERTYDYREDGVVYVNYAAKEGDVILYPDLVQIGVSASDGRLCYVQAQGYFANHEKKRELTPQITRTAASAALPEDCKTTRSRLCLIPTPGNMERLAWEFLCDRAGEDYLIYVDAVTGAQAQIMKLLYSDQGTLTM